MFSSITKLGTALGPYRGFRCGGSMSVSWQHRRRRRQLVHDGVDDGHRLATPPGSRTSPVEVTVAVTLSWPDPTRESKTPSTLMRPSGGAAVIAATVTVRSCCRPLHHAVRRLSIGTVQLQIPLQMFTVMPSSRPIDIRDRDAVINHHRSFASPVIDTAVTRQRDTSGLLRVAVHPAPRLDAAAHRENACAKAPVAIVMATSMQNAENANLIFI